MVILVYDNEYCGVCQLVISTHINWNSAVRKSFPSSILIICVLNYFCQYGLRHIYFILCVMIYYCPHLFCCPRYLRFDHSEEPLEFGWHVLLACSYHCSCLCPSMTKRFVSIRNINTLFEIHVTKSSF